MTEKNIVKTIHDTMHEEMARDDRVILLGEDVGARGGVFRASAGFLEEFGEERVIDTPLAESSIVGVAIGMALHGLLPIAEIQFADFIHPAFDQIVSEAARIHYRSNGDFSVPLVIRAPYGGGVHGALYHSQSVESLFAHVPGLKVVAPSNAADVVGLLRAAIDDPDPVVIFEHATLYGLEGDLPPSAGAADIEHAAVRRAGRDVTLIAYGANLHKAMAAAELLSADKIEAEVIDLRSLRPLDDATIMTSVRKTRRAVVIDEAWRSGSLAAEIAARIAEEAFFDLDAPLERVCSAEVPVPYAKHLEEAALPQVPAIVAAARRALGA